MREGEQAVYINIGTEQANYRCYLFTDEERDLMQIFGLAPVKVPEGDRRDVAELIVRANFGLQVGKFELDMEDGEVRYHIAHIMQGLGLEDALIRRVISTTLAMLDRYMPAVLSVIYGNESPADAVRFVESNAEG